MNYIQVDAFLLCLQMEINYLKTKNMDLLIDPGLLYNTETGNEWNNEMAYLNTDEITHVKGTGITQTKRKNY